MNIRPAMPAVILRCTVAIVDVGWSLPSEPLSSTTSSRRGTRRAPAPRCRRRCRCRARASTSCPRPSAPSSAGRQGARPSAASRSRTAAAAAGVVRVLRLCRLPAALAVRLLLLLLHSGLRIPVRRWLLRRHRAVAVVAEAHRRLHAEHGLRRCVVLRSAPRRRLVDRERARRAHRHLRLLASGRVARAAGERLPVPCWNGLCAIIVGADGGADCTTGWLGDAAIGCGTGVSAGRCVLARPIGGGPGGPFGGSLG